jgi:hypothetical protein
MQYIEPREVTIIVGGFSMNGVIEGSLDGFKYESTNSHFAYWFPSGEIDSLKVKTNELKPEQIEIIEGCKNKIKELLRHG